MCVCACMHTSVYLKLLKSSGSFAGDNVFNLCSTLPCKSNVCLKSAIYNVKMLNQLIWLASALWLTSRSTTVFCIFYFDKFCSRTRKRYRHLKKKKKSGYHFHGLQIIKILFQDSFLPGRNLRGAKKSSI